MCGGRRTHARGGCRHAHATPQKSLEPPAMLRKYPVDAFRYRETTVFDCHKVEHASFAGRGASAEVQRLWRRTVSPAIQRLPSARTSPSDRYRRLSSPIFRLWCHPCRTGRSTTMQCAVRLCRIEARRCDGHICGKLGITVTDVHAIVLRRIAPQLKARSLSPSPDFISEWNKVPVPTGVWTFHP